MNPGGRQADLKGGSGWAAAPQEESDDGGGGFPRTLKSGRSPVPTCPGTKYPIRGIPHFDEASLHIVLGIQDTRFWEALIEFAFSPVWSTLSKHKFSVSFSVFLRVYAWRQVWLS